MISCPFPISVVLAADFDHANIEAIIGTANVALHIGARPGALQALYTVISERQELFVDTKLHLVIDDIIERQTAASIGRFFLLPFYNCSPDNKPVVIARNQLNEAALKNLDNWCVGQGFAGLSCKGLAKGQAWMAATISVHNLSSDSMQSLFDMHKAEWLFYGVWIEISNIEEYRQYVEVLKRTYTDFAEKYPAVAELYKEYVDLKKQENDLLIENSFLKQEVLNISVYNEILKKSDELNNILKYYHAEYEVLPLWFKRLGHVIKIITGKRKIKF